MHGPLERLGRWIVRRRAFVGFLVLAATLLVGAAAAPRLQNGLPVDFSPQALFMKDAENEAVLERVLSCWGRDDGEVLVLLEGPVFTDEGLETVRALHAAIAGVPDVVRVDSLVTAEVAVRDADGAIDVGPLLPESGAVDPALALERARSQRALRGLLVAPDGELTQLRARLHDERETVEEQGPLIAQIRAAAEGVPLPPGFSLQLSGTPVVRSDIVDQLNADQMFFIPLDSALFAVVLAGLFGGILPGLLPLFAVGIAVIWGMGGMVAAGVTFNVLSILVPTLVLVIGVADGIHLLSRYREELAVDRDREAAMGRTLAHLGGACFLTSFTTAVGFGSLATASSLLIQDFGRHAAIGVGVAFLAVIVALPAMLSWVPVDRVLRGDVRDRSAGGDPWYARWLLALDAAVARRPGRVLAAGAAATALAVAAGAQIRTDSHMLEMYTPDHPVVQVYESIIAHEGGLVPVIAHLEAPDPEAFKDPAMIAKIAELEAAMLGWEEVRWAISAADVIGSVHELLTGEPALPADADPFLLEQELMVAQMGGGDMGLSRLVDADWRRARVLALSTDAGGHEFIEMGEFIQSEGERIFAGTSVEVYAAGDGVIASRGVHRIIDDLITSVGLAFAVILVTLWALLRSFRQALVAMIPNALTLCFTLAALYVVGGELITANVISFAVALGIAVDDTIHFLVRLREERGRRADLPAAIRATFLGAGPALLFTSVLLCTGLGVLVFSELTSTWHFGLLATISLVVALAADLLILPALLHLWGGWVFQD